MCCCALLNRSWTLNDETPDSDCVFCCITSCVVRRLWDSLTFLRQCGQAISLVWVLSIVFGTHLILSLNFHVVPIPSTLFLQVILLLCAGFQSMSTFLVMRELMLQLSRLFHYPSQAWNFLVVTSFLVSLTTLHCYWVSDKSNMQCIILRS